MSKYFTMGFQFVKEKTGNAQKVADPAYDDASERFDLLIKRVDILISDISNVLQSIPSVVKSSIEFGSVASSAAIYAENSESEIPKKLSKNFEKINEILNKPPLNESNKIILESLWQMKAKFDQVEKMRTKRKENQLLCDSARDDLINYQKKNKTEKIPQAQKNFNTLKTKLNISTKEFIANVNELWENQYDIIQQPLSKLVSLSYSLLKKSVDNLI